MNVSVSFEGVRCGAAALAMFLGAALPGCSPYPDDGEFLAGVVYAANFLAGVKTIPVPPVPPAAQPQPGEAVGRGNGPSPDNVYPYFVIATTSGNTTSKAVSSSSPAASPFWENGGKRQPLNINSVGHVYVFDSTCAAPPDYQYDPRLDLIRQDQQYPLFADIPEVLPTNGGQAGRTEAYSAIVEVIHLTAPGNFPCQSIKRFDTAQGRVGPGGDLTDVMHDHAAIQSQ